MKPLLLLLFLSSPVFAQLGGTREQATARWGKPLLDLPEKLTFRKDDFQVTATFWNGKCHHLSIARVGKGADMTPKEINDFLAENLKGAEWIENAGGLFRETKDKKFKAMASPRLLIIQSVAFGQRPQNK